MQSQIFFVQSTLGKELQRKVIEAMFYTSSTERSVLLWEGSAALTVVKRDEKEGV